MHGSSELQTSKQTYKCNKEKQMFLVRKKINNKKFTQKKTGFAIADTAPTEATVTDAKFTALLLKMQDPCCTTHCVVHNVVKHSNPICTKLHLNQNEPNYISTKMYCLWHQ